MPPSYFPDPAQYILDKRQEKSRDNTDLFMDGLDVNFRRKPWDPSSAFEEPDFIPTTMGDEEFRAQDYFSDAQVPSANAEVLLQDAKEQATEALEKYGPQLDAQTRKKLQGIADFGHEKKTTNAFTNILNVIDTPAEMIRLGLADLFTDTKSGVEVTGQDYLDSLLGHDEAIRDRLGEKFVGEGQFLAEGSRFLDQLGVDNKWVKGIGGFVLDVVADPTTYVSFGTVGLGKKLAAEGARIGLQKASKEAVEAVARGTVKDLGDSASKEIASRISTRIDSAIADFSGTPLERQTARDRISKQVLADERRAYQAAGAPFEKVTGTDMLDSDIVPTGTVVEQVNNDVLPLLIDKQFKTLSETAPWFSNSKHIPNFAKGGIQIGAPFGRKRFPMLRIPGTETNRLLSLPFRKPAESIFNKLPNAMQTTLRQWGERTGVEKAAFKQIREGSFWRVETEKNMRDLLTKPIFSQESLRPVSHGLKGVDDAFEKAGLKRADAHKAVRQVLNGGVDVLSELAPPLRQAVEEAVFGDVERGIDGIRTVLATFHDAARRVGMDIGKVQNYSPLVVTGEFGRFLDSLGDTGIDLGIRGSTPESDLGLAIISRYLQGTGESAIGVAGRDLGYSQFAQSNKVTQIFRSAIGGVNIHEDLAMNPRLADVLAQSGPERLTADFLNTAIVAARDDLVKSGKLTRKQAKAFEDAFETDLTTALTAYVASMGEAVQFRDLIRRLKRVGLATPPEKVIDVSATLSSVKGSMSDEVARFVDELADGEGTRAASRLVERKIGGRTLKVPAAVAASPGFADVVSKVNRTFSLATRRTNEMRAAVERAEARLIAQGVPEEIAARLSLSESSAEVSEMLNELADVAIRESDTIQRAALEMAARGYQDSDVAVNAAIAEARRLLAGTNETIASLEQGIRRTLNLPDPAGSSVAIDFLDPANAPAGFATPLQYLHRLAMDSAEARVGRVADLAEEIAANGPALRGASVPQITREAVADLADRLTIGNVTLGDLAKFSSPRVAARIAVELNDQLLETGYRGLSSVSDEVFEATQDLFAAEFGLLRARQADEGVEAAEAILGASQKELDKVAGSLRDSDEMLGDAVDHIAQSVESLQHPILSPHEFDYWREVWAVALSKTGLGPRRVGDIPAKELTQRGSKGLSRELADQTRALWHMATSAEGDRLARRGADLLDAPPKMRRALEAMASGDTEMLAKYMDEFRTIVGSVTDKGGRPLMDAARFSFRPNGRLVYEPAESAWVTLDDVMDPIRSIAADPSLSDLDALAVVKATWDENPSVIQDVSEGLDSFFRQVDSAGGLPSSIEDYEYLRGFAADLDAVAGELGSAAKATGSELSVVRNLLDEVNKVMKGGSTRTLNKMIEQSAEEVQRLLPAEEFEKLIDLLSLASARGTIKPSKVPETYRAMLGTVEEASDRFTMDIAMLRRQAMDLGEDWAGAVAEEAEHFRAAMIRLQGFGDDLEDGIRSGFGTLEEFGGAFEGALKDVRKAGTKLRKELNKVRKDKRLALFLPELPNDGAGLNKFLRQMESEMGRWEPIKASVKQPGYVSPELSGLMGEAVAGLEMTPGVALMLEHMATTAVAVASPLGIRLTSQAMREFESWWKAAATVARPTFVPRNLMGGITNGLLIGVGPRHYAAVNTNVMKFRRLVDDLGVDGAIAELPKNFQPYMRALWDSDLLVSGFSHTLDRLKPPPSMGDLMNPLSADNAVFKLGGKIMESSEDFLRAAAFVRWFDPSNPASGKLAKEMALAVHFDYTSLTRLESSIKKFVPFFVWTRRNLPLQMRSMIEQPGSVTRLLHLKENINAVTEDTFVDDVGFAQSPYLSSFAIKSPFVFDEDTPYWQRLMIDPDIPVHDLEEAVKAFSGGPGSWVEWGIRSVSPRFSTPFESADYDVMAPTGLREILMATEFAHPFDRVGEDFKIPAQFANLYSTLLPFMGEWTRLAGMQPRGGNAAARAGYNIEDGISLEERALASALTLGRAAGTSLQTPADSRNAAFDAMFGIEDEVDLLKQQGKIVETEDLDAYIATLLARAGR